MSMREKTQQYFAHRIWNIMVTATMNNHPIEEIDSALDKLEQDVSVKKVSPVIVANYMNRITYSRDDMDIKRLVDDWYSNHDYDKDATRKITVEADKKLRDLGWKE